MYCPQLGLSCTAANLAIRPQSIPELNVLSGVLEIARDFTRSLQINISDKSKHAVVFRIEFSFQQHLLCSNHTRFQSWWSGVLEIVRDCTRLLEIEFSDGSKHTVVFRMEFSFQQHLLCSNHTRFQSWWSGDHTRLQSRHGGRGIDCGPHFWILGVLVY